MTRNPQLVTIAAALTLGLVAFLAFPPTNAQAQQHSHTGRSSIRFVGNFDVQLSTQFSRTGGATPPGEDGTALITHVKSIELLPEWAILMKREAARDITFVVPREQVVFINAVDR